MLSRDAIIAARRCVSLVEQELGIRLKLANPDFLELLVEYAELNDSAELAAAVEDLSRFAPMNLRRTPRVSAPTSHHNGAEDASLGRAGGGAGEVVEYGGREYPRFQDGREFQGIYRGRPVYR